MEDEEYTAGCHDFQHKRHCPSQCLTDTRTSEAGIAPTSLVLTVRNGCNGAHSGTWGKIGNFLIWRGGGDDSVWRSDNGNITTRRSGGDTKKNGKQERTKKASKAETRQAPTNQAREKEPRRLPWRKTDTEAEEQNTTSARARRPTSTGSSRAE